MKKISVVIGIAILFSVFAIIERKESPSPPEISPDTKVQWMDYDQGMEKAKKKNKPVLLFFGADWCAYCNKMKAVTFQDSKVSDYINENFIPVYVDADQKKELVSLYEVRGLPTSWFLNATGDKLYGSPGYMDEKMFLNLLNYILHDKYITHSFQDYLESI